MTNSVRIAIIIPTYEPDNRFLFFLQSLKEDLPDNGEYAVVVVNDGSEKAYDRYFSSAIDIHEIVLLKHEINCGKGKALKTAFEYCQENYKELIGCITADSDGQHTSKQILKMADALRKNRNALILGVRKFDTDDIPAKSMMGNTITRKVFKLLYHTDVSDTQTGLRAIPFQYIQDFICVSGNRFEYEIRMLIYAVENGIGIMEVPIETIYDSKDNHSTHFRPVVDSVRIYKAFGGAFGRFLVSSLSSSVVDLVFFQLACFVLKGHTSGYSYVAVSTVIARCISATYNYLVNYYYVFSSREKHTSSITKYIGLAIMQMLCSAFFTTSLVSTIGTKYEIAAKIPVDVTLFFISFFIQKRFIY